MTVKWVQQIMKECWRASGRHSAKQWRKVRRFYHSWRGLLPEAPVRSSSTAPPLLAEQPHVAIDLGLLGRRVAKGAVRRGFDHV
jgi:hypothetical protein